MSSLFWIVVVLMAAGALLLVIGPLSGSAVRRSRAVVAVAVILPVAGIALYMVLGNPQATRGLSDAQSRSVPMQNTAAPKKVDSVGNMLEGLEQRLEAEPDDAGGWLLLAKSYHHLDRDVAARDAYKKALALGKSDPAFEQLLNGSTESADTLPTAVAGPSIRGRVSIAAEVAEKIEPTATVFVFAKAVDGSPMPLAVVRKLVSELPFEFVLDDSLAMVAGVTISSAKSIEVTAKVSSTGNAMQPDAGIEASSGTISVADPKYVELVIARKN